MSSLLLKLGNMKFSVSTAAYNSFARQWNYNWSAQDRLQNTPALHFNGTGAQTVSLQGVIYPPQYGQLTFVEDMAALAAGGKPLLMVSGTGKVLGYWSVKSISETGKVFLPGGIPRKITFSLKLEYYGENYS